MKCVILGDSISEGIGKLKVNYVKYLTNKNNIKYYNLAKTGTTINYLEEITNEIFSLKPDMAIIMYGSVDAQIRPNINKNKWGICNLIPKRYKIGGMLDQRAFYSKKWYRYIPDRIDNQIRKVLKKILVITQGTVQWVSITEFEKKYDSIIKEMLKKNILPILISTVYIDNNYFLNSGYEYKKYNDVIKKIAMKNNCYYVDIYNELEVNVKKYGWEKLYSKDHFHPNKDGYIFYSNIINKYIEKGSDVIVKNKKK